MPRVHSAEFLNLIQWNAKSICSKLPELNRHLSVFNFALISETWLSSSDAFIVRGFDTVRKDRVNRRSGGVMILIRSTIKYRRVPRIYDCNGKIEACAVECFL